VLGAYQDVRDAITVPDSTGLAVLITGFVLEFFGRVAQAAGAAPVGAAIGVVNAALKFSTELANRKNGNEMGALKTTAEKLGQDTALTFGAALTSLSQTFDYLYADWGKLSAVATGLKTDEPAWDVSAEDAGQYVTVASDAAKLGYYRALVPVVYDRYEAQGAPTNRLDQWCLDRIAGGCDHFANRFFAYPSSAYSVPVQAPALNLRPAYDNTLVSAKDNATRALKPELMTDMTKAGLYPPYLFLRWPMDGRTCPIDLAEGYDLDLGCIGERQPLSGSPPTVTTHHLPTAAVGHHYRATLAATGGDGTYAWKLVNGSRLPAGITLSRAGVLSGIPRSPGRYRFRVAADDSAAAALTLSVRAVGAPAPGPRPAPPPPEHVLANTGLPTLPLLILASALVLAGVLLTAKRKRGAR
jgi:hypothetical protein